MRTKILLAVPLILAFASGAAFAQSFDYRYTKTQPSSDSSWPPKAECIDPFTGSSLAHGQSVTAWMSASVAWNAACQSEQRACNDGVLGGSYANPSCLIEPALACSLPWGGSIGHGETITAYTQALVPFETECPSQQRGCINGDLSGTASVQVCVVEAQDLTPTAFTMGALLNAQPGGLMDPMPVRITGITGNVPVSLGNYDNDSAIRICTDSTCATVIQDWTSGTVQIRNNQWLSLRTRAHANLSTTISNTVTVGTYSTAFNSTTSATYCGGVGMICQDGTLYAGIADGKPVFLTRCDAGQTYNGHGCAGVRSGGMRWGDRVQVNHFCPAGNCGGGKALSASVASMGSQFQMASYCENLTEGGHSDWYLPSRTELGSIYNVRTSNMIAGTFDMNTSYPQYATSSEISVDNYWVGLFNSWGGFGQHTKDYAGTFETWVRCVRSPA